ncbi:hypothetical protein [Actinomadura gamaensis]|uniref:Uncharacterized protein n=1 Tax=Actinomadura gamaensis TaxID=1763541 RepID=A0ABV9UBS8_9ACTN
MSDLFTAPVLVYDMPPLGRSVTMGLSILDEQGALLATVTERISEEQRGHRRHWGSGESTRHTLLVAAPNGAPYFWVDRLHVDGPTTIAGRTLVVAPDGAPIGHLDRHAKGFALFDPAERQLGNYDYARVLDWQGTEVAVSLKDRSGGYFRELAQGTSRGDRHTLTMHYQLPEPLRTLVLSCPIAFDVAMYGSNRPYGHGGYFDNFFG